MLPVSLILCWWWEEAVADPTDAERSSRNYSTRYRRYLQVLGGGGVERRGGVVSSWYVEVTFYSQRGLDFGEARF